MGDENFKLLESEIAHIKEKVDDIDNELKKMKLSARIAVLEDRQKLLFNLVHFGFGFTATILSGVVVWLFTR